MKLKLVSDGTVEGTNLTDAVTGAQIGGVQSVSVNIDMTGVRGTVQLIGPQVELEGEFTVGTVSMLESHTFEVRQSLADDRKFSLCCPALMRRSCQVSITP